MSGWSRRARARKQQARRVFPRTAGRGAEVEASGGARGYRPCRGGGGVGGGGLGYRRGGRAGAPGPGGPDAGAGGARLRTRAAAAARAAPRRGRAGQGPAAPTPVANWGPPAPSPAARGRDEGRAALPLHRRGLGDARGSPGPSGGRGVSCPPFDSGRPYPGPGPVCRWRSEEVDGAPGVKGGGPRGRGQEAPLWGVRASHDRRGGGEVVKRDSKGVFPLLGPGRGPLWDLNTGRGVGQNRRGITGGGGGTVVPLGTSVRRFGGSCWDRPSP